MSSLVIENFRHGLDTRRSALTSVLGTLVQLRDCHINQGGEIEKRKAFVSVDLTPTVASEVTSILGVEPLKDTIVLFGGQVNLDDGNWPPAGYTYQVLQRGRDWQFTGEADACDASATPNYCTECNLPEARQATEVIFSTSFNDKTFVVAKLADNSYAAFYDGYDVKDVNHAGRILAADDSNLKWLCKLVGLINEHNSYVADLTAALTGFTITGIGDNRFDVSVVTETPTGGDVWSTLPTVSLDREPIPAIPGRKASCFFRIHDGPDDTGDGTRHAIASVKINGVNILSAAVPFLGGPVDVAAAVAADINAGASAFSAVSNGDIVTIYTDDETDDQNRDYLEVTTNGRVIIGNCSLAFIGTGFVLDYIKADGIDLLTGPMTFPTGGETLTAFVERVQDDLNSGKATHGYVSLARQNILKISEWVTRSGPIPDSEDASPQERGLVPIDVRVTPATGETGIVTSGDNVELQVSVDTNPPIIVFEGHEEVIFQYPLPPRRIVVFDKQGVTQVPLRAIVAGGVPPYSFAWLMENQIGTVISFDNPQSDVVHLTDAAIPTKETQIYAKQASMKLVVTDADGNRAESGSITMKFVSDID